MSGIGGSVGLSAYNGARLSKMERADATKLVADIMRLFVFCQHKGACVKSSEINSIIAKRGKCTAQEVVEAASSKLAELFGYEIVRLPADPKSAKKAREEERKRQIDLEKRKQREEEAARKAEAQGRQAKKQNPKPKKPAISGWSFALFYNIHKIII